MNRKRLKETGNYLAMVILLIMEFPVFSFLIALDLTVRYVDCIVPKSLVLFLGETLFPIVMITLVLLVCLAYFLLLIEALGTLYKRQKYTLCRLLLSVLLIKDILYIVLFRLGILGIHPA
jgi:hypothetical protein